MTCDLRRGECSSIARTPSTNRRAVASTASLSRDSGTLSRRAVLCLALLLILSPSTPSTSSPFASALELSPRAPAKAEAVSDPRWGSGWVPIVTEADEAQAGLDDDGVALGLPPAPGEGEGGADTPGMGAGMEVDGAPKAQRPPKNAFAGPVEPVAALDVASPEDGVDAKASAGKKLNDAQASQGSGLVKEAPWIVGGMRHYDEPPGSGGARPTRGWTGKWPPWDKWEVLEEMRKAAFLASGGQIRDSSPGEGEEARKGLASWFRASSKGGDKDKKQIEDKMDLGDIPLGGLNALTGQGALGAADGKQPGGSPSAIQPGAKGHARHGDGSRWACRSKGPCVACAKNQPFPASCHPYGRHRPVECIRLQHSTGTSAGGVAGAPPVLAGGKKGWRRSVDSLIAEPLIGRADAKADKAAAAAVAAKAKEQEQEQEQQATGWDGERVILSGWESCGRSAEEAGWGFAQFVSMNLLMALGALWLLISRQKVMSSRWRGIVERRIGRRA